MKNIRKISFIVLLLSMVKVDGLLASSAGADVVQTTKQITLTEETDRELCSACFSGNFVKASFFLHGSSQHAKNKGLIEACSSGHEAIVQLLISAGADPNVNDGVCLLEACLSNSLIAVEKLFEAGAYLNNYNRECLIAACNVHNEDIVIKLLEAGADPSIKDKDSGETVLDFYLRQFSRCNRTIYFLLLKSILTKETIPFVSRYTNDLKQWLKESIDRDPNDFHRLEIELIKKDIYQMLSVFDALKDEATTGKLASKIVVDAYREFLQGESEQLYNLLIHAPRKIKQANSEKYRIYKNFLLSFKCPLKKESLKPLLQHLSRTDEDRKFVEEIIL